MINLKEMAAKIRKEIFLTVCRCGGGHIGGAMSAADILTVLYFGGILNYQPHEPHARGRDRFVLSKGHASILLYAVLANAGFFPVQELDTFCKSGSRLGGHPEMHEIPGVEATTGALGHGICFATGIALAAKLDNENFNTCVLLGDGECQEGSVWEAALFASHQKLGNLRVIVDHNKLQAMDKLYKIVGMGTLADKWKAFGWRTVEVDGHDTDALLQILKQKQTREGSPEAIIAHTVKGKGVSFMENQPLWHFRLPDSEELKIAVSELGITDKEINF